MNHSINLTHDDTLIIRIPKGYNVDKVVVEEMGTGNRVEYQPTHTTPSNTLDALDCISRQAVKDWIKRWEGYLDQDMIARMQYRVVDIPSADLSSYSDKLYALAYERGKAEIIRCKDCKWWDKQEMSLQGRCRLLQMYPTGEWYCGNAKLRSNSE